MMEILPYGDQAILINFEQQIDSEINDKVIQLYEKLKSNAIEGVTFCIPAYCSLTVGYDIGVYSFEAFSEKIKTIAKETSLNFSQKEKRKISIPVCYASEYAIDAKEVSTHTNLSFTEIMSLHVKSTYRVFMMGFLPGFAYMGKLPEQLFCPRKTTPRKKVEAGSVAIAGFQTGIYPSDAPGGWQIIGRSPIPLFNPKSKNPFVFQTGDIVQFYAIPPKEFLEIKNNPVDWYE